MIINFPYDYIDLMKYGISSLTDMISFDTDIINDDVTTSSCFMESQTISQIVSDAPTAPPTVQQVVDHRCSAHNMRRGRNIPYPHPRPAPDTVPAEARVGARHCFAQRGKVSRNSTGRANRAYEVQSRCTRPRRFNYVQVRK